MTDAGLEARADAGLDAFVHQLGLEPALADQITAAAPGPLRSPSRPALEAYLDHVGVTGHDRDQVLDDVNRATPSSKPLVLADLAVRAQAPDLADHVTAESFTAIRSELAEQVTSEFDPLICPYIDAIQHPVHTSTIARTGREAANEAIFATAGYRNAAGATSRAYDDVAVAFDTYADRLTEAADQLDDGVAVARVANDLGLARMDVGEARFAAFDRLSRIEKGQAEHIRETAKDAGAHYTKQAAQADRFMDALQRAGETRPAGYYATFSTLQTQARMDRIGNNAGLLHRRMEILEIEKAGIADTNAGDDLRRRTDLDATQLRSEAARWRVDAEQMRDSLPVLGEPVRADRAFTPAPAPGTVAVAPDAMNAVQSVSRDASAHTLTTGQQPDAAGQSRAASAGGAALDAAFSGVRRHPGSRGAALAAGTVARKYAAADKAGPSDQRGR